MKDGGLVAVLVHYRTPERVASVVDSLRSQAHDAGGPIRVVVVDNSGDAPEGDWWRVLRPADNLGYAGGFNAAVRAEPDASHYLLVNPDVVLDEGALATLLDKAQPNGAVGPLLFWDRDFRLLQPPTREPESPAALRALSRVAPQFAQRVRRRSWRSHARRHWRAQRPLPTRYLSGACLLIGRSALELVGPMDERYRLYYEETDWLRRLERAGGMSMLVPSARAVHAFDASASQESRRDEWFGQSEALYRRRYGLGADLPPAAPSRLPSWPGAIPGPREAVWFELSPFDGGVPAAAERLAASPARQLAWTPPEELDARVEGFVLTVVGDNGRELGRYRLDGSA